MGLRRRPLVIECHCVAGIQLNSMHWYKLRLPTRLQIIGAMLTIKSKGWIERSIVSVRPLQITINISCR